MKPIRWDMVARAIEMYQDFGYQYVETPWVVSNLAVGPTLPMGKEPCYLSHAQTNQGALVGSAEQGFIELMVQESLPPGRWVSAGPCFRWEKEFDDIHHLTFFKVELIDVSLEPDVDSMLTHAHFVLSELTGRPVVRVATANGFDLEIGGIEVGSYGLRTLAGVSWAYGTGLALPRTTFASRL
jgi:seryl-tRNA synthetase